MWKFTQVFNELVYNFKIIQFSHYFLICVIDGIYIYRVYGQFFIEQDTFVFYYLLNDITYISIHAIGNLFPWCDPMDKKGIGIYNCNNIDQLGVHLKIVCWVKGGEGEVSQVWC